jgi:error-prone DNA polymerase
LVHPYLARRNGEQKIDYIHPDLQPVLERTLGVPLFQEQMLRIAMIMADFDGGEAEELRRAISFHRSPERMRKVVEKLRRNMTVKRVAPEIQEQIVNSLGSFALYGFPESHAISFALLAYASCWLKVHRAPEFYCALLNNQPMGFYSPATLIKDGKRHGVQFRPVCVVRSDVLCQIEKDGSVRLGLNYVQGLHRDKAAEVVRQHSEKFFSSLRDLLTRVPLNKTERRVLAKIGAFNLLSDHRRTALWNVESAVDEASLFSNEGMVDLNAPPSAHESPRATPGRLRRHAGHHRAPSDELCSVPSTPRHSGRRSGQRQTWPESIHCRRGDLPSTPRHRQGPCFHQRRGRNRHCQRHRPQ